MIFYPRIMSNFVCVYCFEALRATSTDVKNNFVTDYKQPYHNLRGSQFRQYVVKMEIVKMIAVWLWYRAEFREHV